MMRTMAPNDLDGRLCLNCALTTPELPVESISVYLFTPRLARTSPTHRVSA